MKEDRRESLVGWFFTGGMLVCAALFFLIHGWFVTWFGSSPMIRHGALDPQTALVGAAILFTVGSIIIACAVIARLRMRR
jgi:hypothetical protein